MKTQPKEIIKKLSEEERKIRLEIMERTVTFITAGLSLVAALAWNDAIQSLFNTFSPKGASLGAKFGYALFITLIIVFISLQLSRISHLARKRINNNNKKK